jgi:ubiquinol-cytochrome c reductase iron-sulfur subunit
MIDGVDNEKRRFLTKTATVVGAVGAGFLAVPFASSMRPSAKAEAMGAPVEVDIEKLEPGQRVVVLWRGKPVWVVRRTPETLAGLVEVDGFLLDPQSDQSEQPASSKNEARAIKPEIFVAVGVCTHLGCSPAYRRRSIWKYHRIISPAITASWLVLTGRRHKNEQGNELSRMAGRAPASYQVF